MADVLTGIGSIAAGGATVALAYYAAKGLSAWQVQTRGTRKIELIDDILTNVYEAEEVFKYMVSPISTRSEHELVERAEGETDEDWTRRASYSVAQLRFGKHQETFSKLRTLAFRAKATLGREASDALLAVIGKPRSFLILSAQTHQRETRVLQLHRQAALGLKVPPSAIERAERDFEEMNAKYLALEPGTEPEVEMAALIAKLELQLLKIQP